MKIDLIISLGIGWILSKIIIFLQNFNEIRWSDYPKTYIDFKLQLVDSKLVNYYVLNIIFTDSVFLILFEQYVSLVFLSHLIYSIFT